MLRYAIINTTTNLVENAVDYENQPLTPPDGFANNYIAIQSDTANIGDSYDGTVIIRAPKV